MSMIKLLRLIGGFLFGIVSMNVAHNNEIKRRKTLPLDEQKRLYDEDNYDNQLW